MAQTKSLEMEWSTLKEVGNFFQKFRFLIKFRVNILLLIIILIFHGPTQNRQ